MKKIKIIYTLLALAVFSGCGDFLSEQSLDEVRPSTIEDLVQLAAGDAYTTSYPLDMFLDMLTDDILCIGGQGNNTALLYVKKYESPLSWRRDMYEELTASTPNPYINHWKTLYAHILGCNTVIEYIDKVTGDKEPKENLRGQMYALRGYYYFILANLYGWPYNYGNPAENPAVPLKLTSGITSEFMTRNSVAEVYGQVEKDLTKGLELMEEYPMELIVHKVRPVVAKALLSRMYLYMENWDEAEYWADEALKMNSSLTPLRNLVDFAAIASSSDKYSSIYDPSVSSEVVWAYGRGMEFAFYSWPTTAVEPPIQVAPSLTGMYETNSDNNALGDLRRIVYFKKVSRIISLKPLVVRYTPISGRKSELVGICSHGIRVAEMYLNRAEARAHKYSQTHDDSYRVKALADINLLRESRYDTRNVQYTPVGAATSEELMSLCRDERRRELSFEGHRWFDLRRYGMERMERVINFEPNVPETFSIEEKSPYWVLPIPVVVLDNNPKLTPNLPLK